MANIKVAVINACSVLTDAQVQPVVPALQTPFTDPDDFISGMFTKGGNRNHDQFDDVNTDPNLLSLIKKQAVELDENKLRLRCGAERDVMLADPEINLTVSIQSHARTGILYAYEVCDACEADELGYKIENTLVSDFVYPAWFESFRKPKSTQFDYGKHIHRPFQLLPGGYIGEFEVTAGTGWHQNFAEGGPYRYNKMRPRVGSRRERRRTPRDEWQESVVA